MISQMMSRKLRWISYPTAIALSSAVLAPAASAQCNWVAAPTAYKTFTIWSGVAIQDSLNRFANPGGVLSGMWTVPNITAATYPKGRCDGTTAQKVAQWIGYDGTGGLPILQAGTSENVTCSLGVDGKITNFQVTYSTFWQWPGPAPTFFTLPFALPGNVIELFILYCDAPNVLWCQSEEVGNPPSQTPVAVLIWDGWSAIPPPGGNGTFLGALEQYIYPNNGTPPLVGNTAEWIVEDPPAIVNGKPEGNIMADYGKVDFSNNNFVVVTDNNWSNVNSYGLAGVTLTPGGYLNSDPSCWVVGFSPLQFSYYNFLLQPGLPNYPPGVSISVAQTTPLSSWNFGYPFQLDFTYCGPGSGIPCPKPVPNP